MESIAQNQFPVIIWREERKLLWNPIHKKALKNRPEERVRLRIIEYLLESGWSRHRITTEEAIKDYSESNLRTDVICYNQRFEPQILIECKAENIPLTAKTAEQVARYNQNVEAPYLLISNGKQDFWYHINIGKRQVKTLDTVPKTLLPDLTGNQRDYDYWIERGFAGNQALPTLRKWLKPILLLFQSETDHAVQYLQFRKSLSDLNLDHYYHVSGFGDKKIALSFLNTAFGGTRLIAILNKEKENKAMAEVNLDLLFDDEQPNTSIYSVDGIQNIDLKKEQGTNLLDMKSPTSLKEISKQINQLFTDHLNL